jgi:hypothetical protein
MSECAAAIDADLALRDMELHSYGMFHICDHLTKGWTGGRWIGQPRRGTAKGDRVANCVRDYYARTPLSRQRGTEQDVILACQRP